LAEYVGGNRLKTVYVLLHIYYEEVEVLGVYTTIEALEKAATANGENKWSWICPVEVDKPAREWDIDLLELPLNEF
jgi:hypothetical protein